MNLHDENPVPQSMDEITIPLDDGRAALAGRLELFGHAMAAVALFTAGLDALKPGGRPLLGGVEMVAAAALARAVVRELRGVGDSADARMGWLNLLAGVVLLVDAYAGTSAGGKLVSPSLVGGILAVGLAFAHPWLTRRRRERRMLRMDAIGISLAAGRLRRFQASWTELRSLNAGSDGVHAVTADGREHRIALRKVRNRDEVADAITRAAAERGIPPRLSGP